MSREIKFQVMDSASFEVLGYEVFNSTLNDGYHYVDYSEPEEERICRTNYSEKPMLKATSHPLARLVRRQSTGLKDKNGVEIYEGDIVKWGHVDGFIELSGARVAVVDMSSPFDGLTFDAFRPLPHRFKLGNFMYRSSTDRCMEVIGNIHQNPELLES